MGIPGKAAAAAVSCHGVYLRDVHGDMGWLPWVLILLVIPQLRCQFHGALA